MRFSQKRKTDTPSRSQLHMDEARQALLQNPRVRQRLVRCVAAAGDTDANAMHLYTLAAGHKFQWTPSDWKAVTDMLDTNEQTVEDWINGNSPA